MIKSLKKIFYNIINGKSKKNKMNKKHKLSRNYKKNNRTKKNKYNMRGGWGEPMIPIKNV